MPFSLHYPQESLEVRGILTQTERDRGSGGGLVINNAPTSQRPIEPTMMVRDAAATDIPAMAALLRGYTGGTTDLSLPMATVLRDPTKGFLQTADYGDHSNCAVAFVSYDYQLCHAAPLWNLQVLFVDPMLRRKGIGRRIMAVVCEKGKQSGAAGVVVKLPPRDDDARAMDVFLTAVGQHGWHQFRKLDTHDYILQ